MSALNPRLAFQLFHGALGIGLLVAGLMGLWHAGHELHEPGHLHYAFVAGLQAMGALLLLVPRTVKWGGAALLVVLLPGFVNHIVHGAWELHQLILAAGVWLVMVQGAAWGRRAAA